MKLNIKPEYEKYLEGITNPLLKEAITVTFEEAFPLIAVQCNNEFDCVNLFISFSELIDKVWKQRLENVCIDNYAITQVYPDLLRSLLDWMDSVPSEDQRDKVFNAFDHVITQIIVETLCLGIKKGTIPREVLNS